MEFAQVVVGNRLFGYHQPSKCEVQGSRWHVDSVPNFVLCVCVVCVCVCVCVVYVCCVCCVCVCVC